MNPEDPRQEALFEIRNLLKRGISNDTYLSIETTHVDDESISNHLTPTPRKYEDNAFLETNEPFTPQISESTQANVRTQNQYKFFETIQSTIEGKKDSDTMPKTPESKKSSGTMIMTPIATKSIAIPVQTPKATKSIGTMTSLPNTPMKSTEKNA